MPDRAAQLELVLFEHEIRTLLQRYCRGFDRKDIEVLRTVFYPDAWVDYGPLRGNALEQFEALFRATTGAGMHGQHTIGNAVIEIDGRTARSETYFYASTLIEVPDRRLEENAGRYLDVFERRDDSWAISRRLVVTDWSACTPLGPESTVTRYQVRGDSGHADPSYPWFSATTQWPLAGRGELAFAYDSSTSTLAENRVSDDQS